MVGLSGNSISCIKQIYKRILDSLNIININTGLKMSKKATETSFSRRISERHRLKMLRNLKEYKIDNPYKACHSTQTIPEEISEQLKRVEYLSSTTISMLKMDKQNTKLTDYQNIFVKMNEACRMQQEKYRSLFQLKEEQKKQESAMMEYDSASQNLPREECAPEDMIATREQISLDFESIYNNLLYKEQEYGLNLLEENGEESECQNEYFKESEMNLMDVQYEHYFVN